MRRTYLFVASAVAAALTLPLETNAQGGPAPKPSFEAEKAEASLRQMRVKLDFAQRDHERMQRLIRQGGATEQEAENAMQAERAAAEEVRAAQQMLKVAEFEVEQARAVLQRARTTQAGGMPESFPIELPEQEGLRLTSNLVHCPPEETHIGMPVKVTFEQHDRVWFPLFEPA